MYSIPVFECVTGFVLGVTKTCVNPPEAAELDSDFKSSLNSYPGSVPTVNRSTHPGEMVSPGDLISRSASFFIFPEISTIFPLEMKMSLTVLLWEELLSLISA
mgnify:CR=1 FL=1